MLEVRGTSGDRADDVPADDAGEEHDRKTMWTKRTTCVRSIG